ncbi:MAG: PH domain-containing protein [Deltaproteobacteria bacterium]|nr:PH domain-containing protein [Deltaproteobacteria bacterium]
MNDLPNPIEDRSTSPGDRTLDRRVVNLWRLQALAGSGFVAFGALGALVLLLPTLGDSAPARLIGGFLAAIVLLALALRVFVWPPLAWACYRWGMTQDTLRIRQGVLFRQDTAIPLSRIQHVDTREGPIEQVFGLARVLVWTASGPSPEGGIPGLDAAEARALRDTLARRGGEDGL